MQKWMIAAALGGVVTYFVHRTHKSYTWVAAAVAIATAYFFWKKG